MKTRQQISSARPQPASWMAAAFWLAGLVAVMIGIAVYANSPSAAGQPPESWPEQSQISRVEGRPTLMMFVHPRCPCSRASIGELARLLVQDRGLGRVHLLFINPAGMSPDWARTDLWRQAARIPGVSVQLDQDGAEAKRFGVETSGQVRLYDASGNLSFSGGITISRGHEGDSPGRDALEDLLAHNNSDLLQPPPTFARSAVAPRRSPERMRVFGCPLFAARCEKGEAACKP